MPVTKVEHHVQDEEKVDHEFEPIHPGVDGGLVVEAEPEREHDQQVQQQGHHHGQVPGDAEVPARLHLPLVRLVDDARARFA
eukprot:CAMPEP_0171689728 /NCGR_PEP_ID=MMETSP0991-20121206/4614_1 /TAXON_ID=483369 /ORGANISM="non described non described, Strain CCMP2098" /LENGTH=81 /DNA_ID=CAMNT_0012277817 /DNA_START=232 /DNA_END=477 /DNA_ORIENTATION=-